MKKLLLSSLLLTSLGGLQAGAQTFPAAWGARMQTVLDSINTLHGVEAGVTAAVYMPGMGLWTGATGLSSPSVPMTTDLRVLIGSNSKLFMAATLLKLQEQSVLSLDDHIGKWIRQDLRTVDTSATIRQLLSHESGMADFYADRVPEYFNSIYADTSRMFTPEDMVDSAGAPMYPKGKAFHYSNSGYALCVMIVKEATGQDYWHNLRNLILDPLRLDSTYAPLHEADQPLSGSSFYGTWFSGWGFTSVMSAFPGGGDLASTPQEMVQWYQRLFSGQVLSAASLQQLTAIEPSSQAGLGIEEYVSPRLGGIYHHSGWSGAFTSEAYYDKDTKASFFIALNTYDDTTYTAQYMSPLLDVFTKEMPLKANDAGITAVVAPTGVVCNSSITPTVTLKNSGTQPLTAAGVHFRIANGAVTSLNWTGSLAPGASTNVTLPAVAVGNGMHSVEAFTTSPNGQTDGYLWNDTFKTRIGANLTVAYNGYFSEGFEGSTTPVLIWNRRNGTESMAGVSRLSGYNSTHSISSSNYSDFGNVSNVDLPAVNLAAGSSPVLRFRYAYAVNSYGPDSLQALISTDCGTTWTSLFHKGNPDLGTGDTTNNYYYPQTASKWMEEVVPLGSYSGSVLIRFRMFNGYGNKLFLDDISVGTPTGVGSAAQPVVEVYPNPATDQLFVNGLAAGARIRLTDMTGRILQDVQAGQGTTSLDLSRLTPGVYLLNSPAGTRKIIKQ